MTNRLMISVAVAALIAGTGFANAQGTSREGASGSTAQQSAPSSSERGNSAAPMNRDAAQPSGSSSDTKSTQSEEKSPAGAKSQRAQENMQGQKPGSTRSENDNAKGGNKDMKAEGRGNTNADSKNAAEKTATDSKSQTTGQAGAGAKLSSEQRTKITTVIRGAHVAPVTNVNFSISVGTRVPRDVSFHPLPAEVVTIYPEWRGYEFILVRDQILVIDPQSFEIVAVIEA